ncbi:PHP domain-containing protein [uncultured Roseovarius sp.]|uniref:PHP domain-containing protein n=1 Tax=uncultured Roseovarius sp. TaxID=293344 RepID=UPI00260ED668|nr:CehA/McbA family metallohydrolase [uncultured Roseovarius sp.]
MTPAAFDAPGRFYRGNLHTHSTLSDGMLEPAEVCRRYKAEGYDFISLTDHFVELFNYPIADTKPFRDNGFTTIPGAELHSGKMENGGLWHILAVGLPEDFAPANAPGFVAVADQETGPEIARRARDAGAFVAVAHPHWSGMTLADARSIDAAHAVEVYNHGCGVDCDRAEGFHIADMLISEGNDLSLIATDDSHFASPDAFGGWVMVKAEANEPDALLAALKAGHFYASQGPDLHGIEVEGDTLRVTSSAVETVIVQGHGSGAYAQHGASMTQAEMDLKRLKGSTWVRVTLVDRAGKRAWSNPIRLD